MSEILTGEEWKRILDGEKVFIVGVSEKHVFIPGNKDDTWARLMIKKEHFLKEYVKVKDNKESQFFKRGVLMSLAQEMRKIATSFHEKVDEGLLENVEKSIRDKASNGEFTFEVSLREVNESTKIVLRSRLHSERFKLTEDLINKVLFIEW